MKNNEIDDLERRGKLRKNTTERRLMLDTGYGQDALTACKRACEAHKNERIDAIKKAGELYLCRTRASRLLEKVADYMESILNRPERLEEVAAGIRRECGEFKARIRDLEELRRGRAPATPAAAESLSMAIPADSLIGIATIFPESDAEKAVSALKTPAKPGPALLLLGREQLGDEEATPPPRPARLFFGGSIAIGGVLADRIRKRKTAEKAGEHSEKALLAADEIRVIGKAMEEEIAAERELCQRIEPRLAFCSLYLDRDYSGIGGSSVEGELSRLAEASESLASYINRKIVIGDIKQKERSHVCESNGQ